MHYALQGPVQVTRRLYPRAAAAWAHAWVQGDIVAEESNVWTIPTGVTSVYVDVSFSEGFVKDSDAGDINVNRVNSSGTVLNTLAVDNENDSGTLTGAAAGSLIRIDVDNDALRLPGQPR